MGDTTFMAIRRFLKQSQLSVAHKAVITKAMTGGGDLDVGLTFAQGAYLVSLIASDLGINLGIPDIPATPSAFFATTNPADLQLDQVDFIVAFERLVSQVSDTDTYFDCLASLQKRRIKYQRILETQPIPTVSQVGPRGLLQYGYLSSSSLAAFLFWRKWLFDIDNRAGQETGYIFEPIVARSIGGQSYPAKKSPIHRRNRPAEGRQVDCVFENRAYEIKLRVTIAASGQGRWGEEKDFPADCQFSGYIPVLIVFDDTQADKLDELSRLFKAAGGEVLAGEQAWNHLEELAGKTMGVFLDKYVRAPIKDLLYNAPLSEKLPNLTLATDGSTITITVGNESLIINRQASENLEEGSDPIPDDMLE